MKHLRRFAVDFLSMLLLVFCSPSSGLAQFRPDSLVITSSAEPQRDTATKSYDLPLMLGAEFISAAAVFNATIFGIAGKSAFVPPGQPGVGLNALGAVASWLTVPLALFGIENVFGCEEGNFWAGIFGAVIGTFATGPIYLYLFNDPKTKGAMYASFAAIYVGSFIGYNWNVIF